MTSKPVEGYYGERTAEYAHLFSKSLAYHQGYVLGKWKAESPLGRKMNRTYAEHRGGDYLLGYLFGVQVRKHGIKKAIRKAKQ